MQFLCRSFLRIIRWLLRKRFPSWRCHVRAILWRLYPAPFLKDRPPSNSSRFMLISSTWCRLLPLASRFQPSPRVRLYAGRARMKDNIYVPFMLFAYHIAWLCIRVKMRRESHCRQWANKTPRPTCLSLSIWTFSEMPAFKATLN